MSGLKRSAKEAVETMTSTQKLDVTFRKFTKPTAEPRRSHIHHRSETSKYSASLGSQ
jgi:hypothetical protein